MLPTDGMCNPSHILKVQQLHEQLRVAPAAGWAALTLLASLDVMM